MARLLAYYQAFTAADLDFVAVQLPHQMHSLSTARQNLILDCSLWARRAIEGIAIELNRTLIFQRILT
jgi:hypothetical protein